MPAPIEEERDRRGARRPQPNKKPPRPEGRGGMSERGHLLLLLLPPAANTARWSRALTHAERTYSSARGAAAIAVECVPGCARRRAPIDARVAAAKRHP